MDYCNLVWKNWSFGGLVENLVHKNMLSGMFLIPLMDFCWLVKVGCDNSGALAEIASAWTRYLHMDCSLMSFM